MSNSNSNVSVPYFDKTQWTGTYNTSQGAQINKADYLTTYPDETGNDLGRMSERLSSTAQSDGGIEIVAIVDGKIGYCLSSRGDQYFNNFYQPQMELKERMMEESRILYVAMTRAIDNFIWFVNLDAIGNNWSDMLKEM